MTKDEMIKRIENLREWIFLLEMKDHWNSKDFEDNWKMNSELNSLRKQVKALEEEA